jgi:hypothetical protein
MVMLHNDRVGDISTVQAAPPDEIHLAACVQNVHEMIMDHMALAPLASHMHFSFRPHHTSKAVGTCPRSLSPASLGTSTIDGFDLCA